jgi:hypothetical protein
MRDRPAEGTWGKAYALTAPGLPVFGDLKRRNGADPPSSGYGAASMEARAGEVVTTHTKGWLPSQGPRTARRFRTSSLDVRLHRARNVKSRARNLP